MRPLHARQSRTYLVLCLASMLIATSVVAADNLSVSGSKLRWTASLPSGWLGGTAQQIERVLASTDNDVLGKVLPELLLEAKHLDVYYVHIDVTGVRSNTLSSLRANTARLDMSLSDAKSRALIWQKLAPSFQANHPRGSKTTVSGDKALSTAGRPAFEARFRTTLPDGSTTERLLHVIELPDGSVHLFTLDADTTKMPNRERDLRQLLTALRYG